MTAPVALITGAARRIGAELARTFHARGYDIALHCNRSKADAAALCEKLNAKRPGSSTVLSADLADTSSIGQLAADLNQWRNRLDVLINNASSFYPTPLTAATEADWDNLIGSNLKGPFFLCQALAPSLSKTRGCIINITDIHARQPLKNHSIYCIAKAGNLMLTKALAKDLAPEVRVNGIAPGAILWPEHMELEDSGRQQIVDKIPLGRTGSPEDIAATALFLVQKGSYLTGVVIAVDGGRSA